MRRGSFDAGVYRPVFERTYRRWLLNSKLDGQVTSRTELIELWGKIEARLEAAASFLPSPARDGDEGGTIENYREWLDHNELGLALEELQMLGEANTVPDIFWVELETAASLMGLEEEAKRCLAHVGKVVQ